TVALTIPKYLSRGPTSFNMICWCPMASVPKLGSAYPQGYAKWFRGYAGRTFPRQQKTDGIRRMYRLKQNCNFQTKTSFCASKSPKFPCILPCKTAFLSHKHNNDRDNEQTLIQEQITEKMSRLCWTTLRPRPLLNCLWTHTHLHVIFPIASKRSQAHT